MDDSIDYAALVNNYLADERMARQLQEEEHAVLAPPLGNFSRIFNLFVLVIIKPYLFSTTSTNSTNHEQ